MWDFLFTYYSLRPRHLRRWHPGYGVVLGGAAARDAPGPHRIRFAPRRRHGDREHLRARAETVRLIAELLRATATRAARLNCFGLHEWAMVYRAPAVRQVRCRCDSGRRAPTPWSSQCHCAAATLTHKVLHRARGRPQRARTEPGGADRHRAAGLHTCGDGLLQVGLQARPADRLRPAGGLPGVGRRRPRNRHARQPLRPQRLRIRADRDRGACRSRRVRPRPAGHPAAGRTTAGRPGRACDLLLTAVRTTSRHCPRVR